MTRTVGKLDTSARLSFGLAVAGLLLGNLFLICCVVAGGLLAYLVLIFSSVAGFLLTIELPSILIFVCAALFSDSVVVGCVAPVFARCTDTDIFNSVIVANPADVVNLTTFWDFP